MSGGYIGTRKVLIVGENESGGSVALTAGCIIHSRTFHDVYRLDFPLLKGMLIRLDIWGLLKESYTTILPYHYRDTNVIIIIYTVDDRVAFWDATEIWASQITRHYKDQSRPPVFLVAKNIHRRVPGFGIVHVTREEGEEAARRINAQYVEVSDRTGEGIRRLFAQVAIQSIQPLPSTRKSPWKMLKNSLTQGE